MPTASEPMHEDTPVDGATLLSELRHEVRDAAADVLKPAVRRATTGAALYVVTRGPEAAEKVAPVVVAGGGAAVVAMGVAAKRARAVGVSRLAKDLSSKLPRKRRASGHARRRHLPVHAHVDVAVAAETAYDRFARFDDWPRSLHRVISEAEIVEEVPAERLVWCGTGPAETVGVATFHRLSAHLTRVQVNLDARPRGLLEKAASTPRMSRRALRSGLLRFRASAEMADATG